MPVLKNLTEEEIKNRKAQKTKERNKRNNDRLKQAREDVYKNNPNKILTCTTCTLNKPINEFYKNYIHVRFENQKPVDISTGECKECARLKQKKRDKQKKTG